MIVLCQNQTSSSINGRYQTGEFHLGGLGLNSRFLGDGWWRFMSETPGGAPIGGLPVSTYAPLACLRSRLLPLGVVHGKVKCAATATATAPPDAQQDVVALGLFAHRHRLVGAVHGLPVDFDDHIAGAQPRLGGIRVLLDVGDQRPFYVTRDIETPRRPRLQIRHLDSIQSVRARLAALSGLRTPAARLSVWRQVGEG